MSVSSQSSANYYNPGQDYTDMKAYSDYLGSLSGKGDWEGGVTMWNLMYLMYMMCGFDSDTIGSDAAVDADINAIKDLTEKLNNDLNAGNSTIQDSYGNYKCQIDGTWYYCDADAKVDGKKVDKKDTLAYKMQQDVDAIKDATAKNQYFIDNPQLQKDINTQLDDYMSHINNNGGNVHKLWAEVDPQHFDPYVSVGSGKGDYRKNADGSFTYVGDGKGDYKVNDQLGNASVMQPLTDDLMSVQKQYENGDSVMQAIIKSLTSLVETEQSTMENMSKTLSKMEGTMNQHMSQGT